MPGAEMRTLTAEQARELLRAAVTDRLAALYSVALASGARQGELLGLKWADVDWDNGVLRIRRSLTRGESGLELSEPKTTSSRRSIPLGTGALDALRSHRTAQLQERLHAGAAWRDNDLIFASEVGTPLDAGNVLRSSSLPVGSALTAQRPSIAH